MIPGKVSIIIPCYNAAKYLDEAIDSLRSQTYSNIEILAVNDGSTDETQTHLEQQAANDPRVRIFSQKNAGPSAARNTALRQVNGEYVCFLDADDICVPDKLERQVRFLAEHPGVDLVYSDYYTSDEELNLTALSATRINYTDMVEAFAIRNWFAIMVPMFRSKILKAVGEFDDSLRMAEDWDYWIRCARVAVFGYLPGAMVVYRTHGEQSHHDTDRMFAGGKVVLRKHFRSDRVLYQRALASWYKHHAKARWHEERYLKTAMLLAGAALHSKLADAAARLVNAQPPSKYKQDKLALQGIETPADASRSNGQ